MKLKDLRTGVGMEGDCGSDPSLLPSWMDKDKFQRGQDFFRKHITALTLALHCSLTTGLSVVNLLDPLVFTGKSDTPQKSLWRYLVTYLHIAVWHLEDVWRSPEGRAWQSVQAVRHMHKTVALQMAKKKGDKVYVSQYDMSLVQCGFMGAIVMYPHRFGIRCSMQELDDYCFFWRGIGHLLGMELRYNICSGDLCTTLAVCKEIEQIVLLPSLRDPPDNFEHMAEAYVSGVNRLGKLPGHTKEAITSFSFSVMGQRFMYGLSWTETIFMWGLKVFVFSLNWLPFFERLCNKLMFMGYDRLLLYAEETGKFPKQKQYALCVR